MEFQLFLACGCFGFFLMMFKKETKEKTDEKENPKSIINDLEIKTSMNTIDIHKLYLENIELRNKI